MDGRYLIRFAITTVLVHSKNSKHFSWDNPATPLFRSVQICAGNFSIIVKFYSTRFELGAVVAQYSVRIEKELRIVMGGCICCQQLQFK